jgi:hypothetical protein
LAAQNKKSALCQRGLVKINRNNRGEASKPCPVMMLDAFLVKKRQDRMCV